MNKLYQLLYDEFGEEETHIARREITTQTKKQPTYIELLAALSIKKGYKAKEEQIKVTNTVTNTYHVTGRLEKYAPVGDIDYYDHRTISTYVEATSPQVAVAQFAVGGWFWIGAPAARLVTEAMKLEEAEQPSLFPLPEKR